MRSHDSTPYYDHHAFQLGNRAPVPPEVLYPFLAALAPNSRVIDLGCGVGADMEVMAQAGHQVTGLDSSAGMRAVAQAKGREVEAKNILFWTPREAEWNGVWSHHAFQHLSPEEVQRVVASAFRGLASGGILGVVVPEGSGAYEDRAPDLAGPSRWIHPYTENQLCSMVEQTGFKVTKVGRRQTEFGPELMILANRI